MEPIRVKKRASKGGTDPGIKDDPHLRNRTRGRELAMKLLYMQDIRKTEVDAQRELRNVLSEERLDRDAEQFGIELFEGVSQSLSGVDGYLKRTADNWDLERMAFVDRAVLRLGTYELLHRHDIPPKVSISEAIELAKKFSTDKSSAFVNGILDRIHKECGRLVLAAPGAATAGGLGDGAV